MLNADEVTGREQENASNPELHAVLRTDLDHTAHTFLGYTDGTKRRQKVDAWMRKPDAIDWQAEIHEARRHDQEVRFGQEEAEQIRLLLAEHLPVAGSLGTFKDPHRNAKRETSAGIDPTSEPAIG